MSYDIQLRAYQPGTDTPLGLLPSALSWQASVVHNNDGALTVKYSELAENGAIAARGLNAGLDIGLEINWSESPTGWVEPDNCRFLLVGDDFDKQDPAKVRDLTMPSWSWLLNKICDLNLGALAGKKSKYAGQRVFPATSDAGDVCKKMLDEHDARPGPAVPVLRDSWTTTKDSGGHNWAKKLGKNADGRAFPAGQPLHEKLDALTANGLCDWRTRGRGLRIYNPKSASADLSATVRLLYGEDLTDAPSKTSQADRVARILVKGDGKRKVTVKDPTVPEHYGRWEAMIDSAGVKDDDDLEDAGNEALDDRNRIKGEYTRTLTMSGKWLPFRDYQVGDWVTAPGADGDERLRVMQITITRDEQNGLSGNIVLGDRFTSKDLALAGRVSAITGGTTGVIGNGTTVLPEPQDFRQPAAPTGLALTGTLYVSPFGEHRVRLGASWDAVTTATDGTELDIAGYELWGQPQGQTPAAAWRRVTGASGLSVEWPDFPVGSQWLFTVRALGVTTTEPGVQSATAAITFGTDTVAPNQPSTPTVSSQGGALMVGWDGLDSGGAGMPADFARCEIHLSATSGFTPTTGTRRAVFLRGGTATLSGLTYGTTYYVRLVCYDLSGNASSPSVQASAVAKAIVATDLDSGVVLPGDTAYSDHNNMVVDGSFENPALTTERLALSPGWRVTTAAGTVAHGARAACYDVAGAVSQNLWLQRENLSTKNILPTPGTKLYVSAKASAWGTWTGALYVVLSWVDNAGSGMGFVTVTLSPTVGSFTLTEGVVTVPAGTAYARISVLAQGTLGAASGVVVDAVRILQVMPTMLIEDLAVTDAKIDKVRANKIDTGELAAGVRVSAGPLSGTHAELTSAGFAAWAANVEAGSAVQSWLRIGDANSEDAISIGFDPDNPVAAITADGHAVFQSVSAEALKVAGDPLDTILAAYPRGLRAYARTTSTVTGIGSTEAAVIELRAILQPGRTYEIRVHNIAVTSTAANNRWAGFLRAALDGNPVSTSSALERDGFGDVVPVASVAVTQKPVVHVYRTGAWSAEREVRLLLSASLASGSGSVTVGGTSTAPVIMSVHDVGPDLAPSTTQIQRVAVWNASAMYQDGAGASVTAADIRYANTYTAGDYAHCLFNAASVQGEAGTVAAVTSGASIVKAEVYLYDNTSRMAWIPVVYASTATAANATTAGSGVTDSWTPPSGKWVDITSIWTTASRSVHVIGGRQQIGSTGNYRETLGELLNTSAHPVQLRITYLK